MKSFLRYDADAKRIEDGQFVDLCRSSPADFTRKRKLPLDRLILSALANKGRSLRIELWDLAKRGAMEGISVPGYLKQREKLNPLAFLDLARFHAGNIYADGDVLAYKGHLLLAIDGTKVNLPTTELTCKIYGNVSNHGRPQAQCGVSALYDTLNRQLLDVSISPADFDERSEVIGHLASLEEVIGKRPYIVVMDRGYPSLTLMFWLINAGIPFVIRSSERFLAKEFDEALQSGGDKEVPIALDGQRLSWAKKKDLELYRLFKEQGSLDLRLVLADIGNASPERLITNLPKALFDKDDLKEIYHLRWNIETCFGMLKDKLQLENFTGTKPVFIEQDIYASMYLLNVAFDIANEADRENEKTIIGYRHKMTVNRGFALGVIKEEVVRLVLCPKEERERIKLFVLKTIRENLVPVRENRAFKRPPTKAPRQKRYSNTHKRVF